MNTEKKLIINNSIMYTVSNVLLNAFQFLLLPLYTTCLTTADYGTTDLIASFSSIAIVLFSCNLSTAISRFYNDIRDDNKVKPRFFSTSIYFIGIAGIVFLVVFCIFNKYLVPVLFSGISFFPNVLLGLSVMLFSALNAVYATILQTLEKGTKSAIMRIVSFFVHLGLSMLFVVVLKYGATGVLLANLISYFCEFIYILIDMRIMKCLVVSFDTSLLRGMLKYTIPIIPHTLSSNIAEWISRLLLNSNFSLSAVGLYSVASRIGGIGNIVLGSTHSAMTPWYFRKMDKGKEGYREINELVSRLMIILGIVFMLNAIFAQEAIILMTDNAYHEAWKIVPLFVLIYVIKTPYMFYINFLFYDKKLSQRIFVISIVSSLVDILLSAFLIPRYDLYGSVVASILAMCIRTAMVIIFCAIHKCSAYRIRSQLFFILKFTLFSSLAVIPGYVYFDNEINGLYIIYKIFVVGIYSCLVVWPERKYVKSAFGQLLNRAKGR